MAKRRYATEWYDEETDTWYGDFVDAENIEFAGHIVRFRRPEEYVVGEMSKELQIPDELADRLVNALGTGRDTPIDINDDIVDLIEELVASAGSAKDVDSILLQIAETMRDTQ
jgi:hypothetical protein